MQQISISFNTIEEFQQKAGEFNVSNPSKWEERVVLLPNVLCCPTALLERIGYYDTRYFRGEFLDDDISFRIRRAGYKLIYCADTITHHYGSLTTVSDHQTNSLQEGRQTFLERYGLDAWLEARMDIPHLKIDYASLSGVESILGVDVKCGATLLQVKNNLWSKHGIKPRLTTCTTNSRYLTDLKTISERVVHFDHLSECLNKVNEKFDLIYIETFLDLYQEDLNVIWEQLSRIMKENGKVIFLVNHQTLMGSREESLNSIEYSPKFYSSKLLRQQTAKYGFEEDGTIYFTQDSNELLQYKVGDMEKILAGDRITEEKYILAVLKAKFRMHQMVYSSELRH